MRSTLASADPDVQIGEAIRLCRRRAGLTQVEVARHLHCAQSRIAKLEGGRRRLSYLDGMRLADLFGVPPDAFAPADQGT